MDCIKQQPSFYTVDDIPAIAHSQIKKIDGTIAIDPKTEAKFRRSFQPHNSRKKTQQPKEVR